MSFHLPQNFLLKCKQIPNIRTYYTSQSTPENTNRNIKKHRSKSFNHTKNRQNFYGNYTTKKEYDNISRINDEYFRPCFYEEDKYNVEDENDNNELNDINICNDINEPNDFNYSYCANNVPTRRHLNYDECDNLKENLMKLVNDNMFQRRQIQLENIKNEQEQKEINIKKDKLIIVYKSLKDFRTKLINKQKELQEKEVYLSKMEKKLTKNQQIFTENIEVFHKFMKSKEEEINNIIENLKEINREKEEELMKKQEILEKKEEDLGRQFMTIEEMRRKYELEMNGKCGKESERKDIFDGIKEYTLRKNNGDFENKRGKDSDTNIENNRHTNDEYTRDEGNKDYNNLSDKQYLLNQNDEIGKITF